MLPEWSLRKCPKLASIITPDSVTTIGDRALSECPSLTSVTLSRRMTSLPGDFLSKSAIESIVIPASIRTVHDDALTNCPNLRVVLTEDPSLQLPEHLAKLRPTDVSWP